MHKLAATSSVPSLRLALDISSSSDTHRPTSSGGLTHPSSPLHRANSHPLQRSPSQKQRKPPASHSSYGVETFLGPPPSYSTQRTLSQDRVRSLDRNGGVSRTTNSNATRDTSPGKSNELPVEPESITSRLSPVKVTPDVTNSPIAESSGDELNPPETSSSVTADSQSLLTPTSSMSKVSPTAAGAVSGDEKETMGAHQLQVAMLEDDGKGSSSDERKSEDLFLNIAKADATRVGQQSKMDKRRSRISLPFFSNTRPSTSYKSSPIQQPLDTTTSPSTRSDALNYYSKRASLGQHVPGALSRAYTHETAPRDGHPSTQDTQSNYPADLSRRVMPRRYSNTNTEAGRQRPNTARTNRLVSESGFQERSRLADHNATESTISTGAPSTVWDEMDDLKSRIRKLELRGKLPASSAAAMTSSERPKTATTAATTMSSSPKQKSTAPPLPSAVEGIPSTVHPLLHEALGNAKGALNTEVFQKLQATAQDALQLSMMMHPEGSTVAGSTVGNGSLSERQVRRRTESMCRSLTELAIAILADNKPVPAPVTRPASRDNYQPLSAGLRSRRYSNDVNERPPVTSRVQSRLDSRRTSVPLGAAFNPQPTADHLYQTPPAALPQIQTNSSSRIGRTSTSLRTRRTPGYLDGATDDEEASPSVRPVSRAMTEVSTYRQMARDRAAYSREYTAQHPMPASKETTPVTRSAMPANVSSNLISRRKYASPSSVVGGQERTPVTPKEAWGRITIVPGMVGSSPVEAAPESPASIRQPNSRRSLGFSSRITSVSNRLRAAKADRGTSLREAVEARGGREIASAGQQEFENHNISIIEPGRQGSGPGQGLEHA
ncbi:uncharacterized protein A1O9_05844 [Exophiala aquamarina CBS 119918]|uniref:LPXTG-motif cell wall anchor domain-containing protein n=1 Tax=Exophiala aquamarina CBS 119918 TaxID=1182545 RepID=A0A072PDT4_9EURO|nr:uncharacterized protein A1O9_05844 [Exophiala aquamarina CBS 119918]KEF57922.1 hypothetical protein A1O9_05844 [Exophiala aquamarina CBS 119918]